MQNVKCKFFLLVTVTTEHRTDDTCYPYAHTNTVRWYNDQGIAEVQEILLFSRNVQTDSGVHPASCLMDTTGLSPWVK